MLDTGAHFYDVYETSDSKFVSVGAIEPHFYGELLDGLGLDAESMPDQHDANRWDESRAIFAARIAEKTRAEWEERFEGSDACFAPVLEPSEAPSHQHNVARKAFVEIAGVVQPAPAPHFDRTPTSLPTPPAHAGQHTDEVLSSWGFSAAEISELRDGEAIA